VIDGKFISGGGVTAGIDFALAVIDEIRGREAAETIQLMVEYDPQPPFEAGSPERASPAVLARVRRFAEPMLRERAAAVERAAAALAAD
jgi:cyclohexyl-isocyanide hydratase